MHLVNHTDIYNLIASACVGAVRVDGLTDGMPLRHHGYDSLDMMLIVQGLEDRFALTITDEDAARLITVDSMVAYLNERLAAGKAKVDEI